MEEDKRLTEELGIFSPDKDEETNLPEEILKRLFIGFKIVRIYAPNNLMFLEQIKTLFSHVKSVLSQEGEALFSLKQNTIFFNRLKLKFFYYNYHIFRFVIDEFKRKGIKNLNFKPGLTDEELKQFLVLLAQGEPRKMTPFEEFAAALKKNGITHIIVDKIAADDLQVSRDKRAIKDFFLSIIHLNDIFIKDQGTKPDKRMKLHITRRLMQSILTHIIENESFVLGLTNIKNYDEYTLNHSVNVCILSMAMGRRLGLDKRELVDLGICAFFHDIGKLDIPKEILNKPAKLTEKERDIIEKHPYQGAGRLFQFEDFHNLPLRAIHVTMEHHIKEDFSGYPLYLKKKSVNLYSKIVKIVDFFDAITTKRIYRPNTFTRDEALALMAKTSGTEFNPLLLKVFINMLGAFPVGTFVLLDSSEVGIVVETNPEAVHFLTPKVKIIADKQGKKIDGEIVDLSEVDLLTNKYKLSIVKSLDPEQYNIKVSDYILAQAQ